MREVGLNCHLKPETQRQSDQLVFLLRSSSVVRQFARKWTLPGDCDPNDVISNLSSDGVLMVTAPRKGLTHDPRKAIQH